MKWLDLPQNTDEWLEGRGGRIGGSSIGSIMANYGKAFGEPAHKLAVKLSIEQITGRALIDPYTNDHMQRGHEQEPIARALYESEYFCEVTNGGFYYDGDIGFSPDGLVYNDGIIEIKSVIPSVHFKTVSRGLFDPSYKWQLYFNLLFSERIWMDFISFCADFPEGKRLFVSRIMRQDCGDVFSQINTRLDEFRALIQKKKEIIINIGV